MNNSRSLPSIWVTRGPYSHCKIMFSSFIKLVHKLFSLTLETLCWVLVYIMCDYRPRAQFFNNIILIKKRFKKNLLPVETRLCIAIFLEKKGIVLMSFKINVSLSLQ